MDYREYFNRVVSPARADDERSGHPVTYEEYRDACLNKEAWEDVARRMRWDEEWTAEDERFSKTVLPTLGL